MHNVDKVLDKIKNPDKYKITLEVNSTTFPVYFDTLRDKHLFVELMSDYFEDMECSTENGRKINPKEDNYA